MIRDDEIRKMLRGADPAEGRDLDHAERARMRAAVMAASVRPPRRSVVPALAMGAALATTILAIALWNPRHERPAVVEVPPPPKADIPPQAHAPATAVPAVAPLVVSRPRPPKTIRPRIEPAAFVHGGPTTRIMFTAPEGTRILWFVGPPDAKELGS